MKNFQKGFMVPLLLIIIGFLIFGGGIYLYTHRNQPSTAAVPNITATTSAQTEVALAVPHMSQYVDSSFGFSFWYPSAWRVAQVPAKDQNRYPGGTVLKQLNVTNGARTITIEEFTSPTFSITDSTGVGACPVCETTHYYFDASQHVWMVEFPNGTSSGRSGSPAPANVSSNTMGGLHMLSGSERFGANVIIPLSARNFVVVTVDGAIATESNDAQALAKTVVALDPSVATPVSQAEQMQTIQAEVSAYGDVTGTIQHPASILN